MSALALGEEEGEGEGTSTMMIYQWPCPGFLFSPSEEELVHHYLIKKTDPWGIIREFDVYSKDPWDLPGDFLHGSNKNEELFFTPRRCKSARGNGSRVDRTAGSGYWHSNSSTRIHCGSGWVAYKTSLTFKIKDARNAYAGKWVGTDWIMQEYLLYPGIGKGNGFQEKALCKVYNKKKKKGMKQVEEGSWSLPPPSKRARIEVEDEVVHHQEIEEEEGDVGSTVATAVHQETQEDEGDVGAATVQHQETEGGEGDVASASGAAVHQETEEEEGNVGSASAAAMHQEPMNHLESPSTSIAQEAAAQPQGMWALAQAQAQVQISEISDVFSSLDDICSLDDIYALADQTFWDWASSSSFGVGGDMGMYSACGFAQEAPQLLLPHSHSSNPVNAA